MWSNDINQGRPGAQGVPESDQWDDSFKMPRIPSGWKPQNYHKKQVLTESNGRGVAREVQDELFLTRQCRDGVPNPHSGRRDGTRWTFHFPDNWHGQTAVNKAVALRRIDVSPSPYYFSIGFHIIRTVAGVAVSIDTESYIQVSPQQDLWTVLGTIAFKTNEQIQLKGLVAGGNWPQMIGSINSKGESIITFISATATPITAFTITMRTVALAPRMGDFWKLMNVQDPTPYTGMTLSFKFPNAWNRRDLYIHASFVSHTAFGYLGKSGDFYMEPNKMYNADNIGHEFYLQASYDGMTPVELPYEDFDVELSLIVDTKTAMSF
jgi:hypothetical protein